MSTIPPQGSVHATSEANYIRYKDDTGQEWLAVAYEGEQAHFNCSNYWSSSDLMEEVDNWLQKVYNMGASYNGVITDEDTYE